MKKIICMTLCIVMIACTAMTAFASATGSGKITGMADSLTLGYSGSTDLGEVNPQDSLVLYIDLLDSMFQWEDYEYIPDATPTQLSSTQIRAAKLGVHTNANSKVVDKVSINNRTGCIEVKFTEELVSIKELDFDFDVYLTIDGRRMTDYAISFSGTLANPVMEVYSGYDHIDISDGCVAEAQEFISDIDMEIGYGVTINTRLSKGKKVYATLTMTPSNADSRVMDEHKSIEEVLTLNTIGLNSGSEVKLGAAFSGYHVYNKDLAYLGTGKDALEFSEKYYLSKTELELEDNEEPKSDAGVIGDGASVEEPQDTATDSTAPDNVNLNPATGR